MRYVVLGCGAIGGTVAAGLARDGHEVLIADADPRVVEAVQARGIRITGPVEEFTAHAGAVLPGELPSLLAADIADARVTADVLGYIWAKEAYGAMLAAGAVSDLPIADTLDDPAYRSLMIAVARQVLAQAPVPPVPLDGFDPADLGGSLARLAEFNRRSAKTHSGIYRDLAVLHRPTEVAAILGGLVSPQAPLIARILELVRAIERGDRICERSNLDLLAAYERLDRLGTPLNAVATVIGAPGRAADGPLAGEPVAVKDIIQIAGVPTRCGSPASDPKPAMKDAVIVTRLRTAGAEMFAASQCLEYAAGFAHPEIGDTRNPRDPSRTSGGSSGGSAALVAAGACDLSIGTDTGGSIRIPASYCGIVGLKPSYGLVPADGIFPLSPRCDHAGTLTATVADSARLLSVIAARPAPAGPGPPDPDPSGPGPADPDGHSERFSVGVLSPQLDDPSVTPEVRAAVTAALAALARAGWQLRELTGSWLDQLRKWEETLAIIVAKEAFAIHEGRDTSRYGDGTRALLAFGASVTDEMFARALGEQAELTAAVELNLAGVDVLAGPTVGYTAPEQDPPFGLGDDNGEGRFTGPYNLTGHPALSMPVPIGGLPAGLQLAGRRGADFELLAVAAAAEAVFAGITSSNAS